jgi:hypothetical protein
MSSQLSFINPVSILLSRYVLVLLASLPILLLLFPISCFVSSYQQVSTQFRTRFTGTMSGAVFQSKSSPERDIAASRGSSSERTPVYFLSIGGPNFIEDIEHPAYSRLAAVGREITSEVKPKAVVVFSAHWQGGPTTIKINVAEETDLIYDFYGFPAHYYEYEYPNKGDSMVA